MDYFLNITARIRSLGLGNIFSSACQGFCPKGGSWIRGAWSWRYLVLVGVPGPRGVPGPDGGAWSQGGGVWRSPSKVATAAGSTYPTGIHSCFHRIQRNQ